MKLGSGFFADAYYLFVIDIVLSILKGLSTENPDGMGYSTSTSSLIASATSAGAVVGMIGFGVMGDYIGRLPGLIITGSLVVIGAILSACCFRSDTFSLCSQLALYRVILGIGIGGEYPLSATMASEGSDAHVRGRVVAGVFSMQGLGLLFSSLLAFIVIKSGASLEFTWRFLLAFGCLPALIGMHFRLRMREHHKIEKSEDHPPHHVLESNTFCSMTMEIRRILKLYQKPLLATGLSWFLLDITFYGTGEFRHSISAELFPKEGATVEQSVNDDATFGLIIAAIAVPGYICATTFIDRIGHWNLQVYGFCSMTVAYVVMALVTQFNSNLPGLNLAVFGLTFFFTTFGPNTTTFIIPSEIYPRAVNATCNGVSAAFGKVGAIIGTAGFPPALDNIGLDGIMYVCAGIAACGIMVTWFILDKESVDLAASQPREPTAAAAIIATNHGPHICTCLPESVMVRAVRLTSIAGNTEVDNSNRSSPP